MTEKQQAELFSAVQDGHAVIRGANGLYRQAGVYRRGKRLYVQIGGAYARIDGPAGGESLGYHTSSPAWTVVHLDLMTTSIETVEGRFGHLHIA